MSGHINLQTSWVLALLERAIIGSGIGGGGEMGDGILQGFVFTNKRGLL
jgi:hypothetical protein